MAMNDYSLSISDDGICRMHSVLSKDSEFYESITKNTLFKYENKPALGCSYEGYTQVEDKSENNLVWGDFKTRTLPREAIEEIKHIIDSSKVMEIKELEISGFIDGTEQYMHFRSGDKENALAGGNQWVFKNKENTNAYEVISTVDAVLEVIHRYIKTEFAEI